MICCLVTQWLYTVFFAVLGSPEPHIVTIMERSPVQHGYALCRSVEAHVIHLQSHCPGINQAARLQATLPCCITSTQFVCGQLNTNPSQK